MLANFVKLLLSQNRLFDGDYAEVYAGGAGVAWPLLFEEHVQTVHINDFNRSIFAFWHSVIYETENLCKLILDTPISMKEWTRQRSIQKNPGKFSLLELGFSAFFLNRTNRSGIIRGGVIGGKNQTGEWKLDARFNKEDLIARISRIARYSMRIKIYNMDAADFLKKVLPKLPRKTLVYLDPPYYGRGEDLYENYYLHDDHVRISKLIGPIKNPWIVSYDSAPEIIKLYKSFRKIQYDINYSAQMRYAGSEIMFFSNDLVLPKVNHPAFVKGHPSPPLFV